MHRRVSVATAHVHTGRVGITRVRADAPQADGVPDPREPAAGVAEGIPTALADRRHPVPRIKVSH